MWSACTKELSIILLCSVPSLNSHFAFKCGKEDLLDTGGSLCSTSAGMCAAGHPRPQAPLAKQ